LNAIRHETNGAPQASLSIEMVLPSLATGGMEMMARDLALGLAARRHRVGITCLEEEGELAAALRDSGVSVSLVACPGVRPNFFPHAKLSAHVAARGCNVVHAHNGVWAKAALASCSVRVPAMVSTLHGFAYGEGWQSEPLRWWGALHADVVVAVSASLRRHLVQRTRIPASKVTVLANGIDTARFAPGRRSGTIRSRFGIAPRAPLIGCVARLDPIKNHALLLASLKLVLQSLPHTRLLLAGEGPLRLQLGALVAEMGLSRSVIFAGAFADTAPLYRDLDVFVLPSLSEGTSISVLEAMASGVPVVATAVGGTPDLLADGACGLLVPSGAAAAMASAIIRLLRDSELRSQLAANGRERVTSTFSLLAMVTAYEELYHSILRKKKHERSSAH
jgi:glycosyltransferase involved in cell wall biosynthesis